jgi:hypothetical protein
MSDGPTCTARSDVVDAAAGVTYAYRRFAEPAVSDRPPILLQRFAANLDYWDAAA